MDVVFEWYYKHLVASEMRSWKLLNQLVVLVVLLAESKYVQSANILALMGLVSPSHHIWNSVLLHALAERGHNLTILSVDLPRADERIPPNVYYIHLEKAYDIYKSTEETTAQLDITHFIGIGPFETIPMFYDFGIKTVRLIFESQGLQQLLAYPIDFKFDLIINDFTLGAYLLGFAHRFNYPPGVSAFHNPPNTMDFMSNHYFPAYVPYHSTSYSGHMNFWQRFHNTLVFAADVLYRHVIYFPQINEIIRPHFGTGLPYVTDLAKLTSISLVNSNPAIDFVEPLPPSVIEIGGIHIQDPEPLHAELDAFINGGHKGAIFFSMGTNMKSHDMSLEKIQIILQAFGNLTEYNFLWKFDKDCLQETIIPSNVLIKSFFPQRDILAHPKIKAFVTHCGGLSSQEATWRGVPTVGIPLFLDQHRNLRQSMVAGCALKVDYLTMTTDVLIKAIQHVAEDQQMATNVQKRSRQFRDMPMKPLETAIWWIEYLLREPNPSHLKSAASELNFFQAHSLDIVLVLVLIASLLVLMLVLVVLAVWGYFNKAKYDEKHLKRRQKND